jgi:hypothetical protein
MCLSARVRVFVRPRALLSYAGIGSGGYESLARIHHFGALILSLIFND